MKKLLLTMAILLLMGAGDTEAQEKIQFTGPTYNKGLGMTTGIGLPLGGGFWNLDFTTVSEDGELSAGIEFARIFSYDDGGFFYGILMGGGIEGQEEATYISETFGVVGGWRSFYGWGKYRLQLDKGTMYENNYSFGAGVKFEIFKG